jgi:YD repeat-containing protein
MSRCFELGEAEHLDPVGHRIRVTDGRGNPTIATYNTLGLPESQVVPPTTAYPNPADRTFTTAHDAAGNPVAVYEPGGVVRVRSYDPMGSLLAETGTGSAGATVSWSFIYDLGGPRQVGDDG